MSKNIPTLDLHGEYQGVATILVAEFIDDNYKLGNESVAIIHGKGSGIIKKLVQELLKKNKKVDKFYINFYNDGETIVKIKKNVDK